MESKTYFNCPFCKGIRIGELKKQTLDFQKKLITSDFICGTCKNEGTNISPLPKDIVLR